MSEWIPVSEKLPPRGRQVLVSYKGSIMVTVCVEGEWLGFQGSPDAWMPLPKPYESEHDEN